MSVDMKRQHEDTQGERARNVVVILNDSFRRDHLNAYGDLAPWGRDKAADGEFVQTPNLDAMAAQSAMFDRFYVSSYPTVPCRTDLFTGRWSFPVRGWQPLEPTDRILPEVLAEHGVTSQLIHDTPMLSYGHYNFMRGFTGWDFVRGQHADRYTTAPLPISLPAAPRKLKSVDATALYLRNAYSRRYERDWMCMRTVSRANDWLEDNASQHGFLLWVDMWDPHEPFDAPGHDLARYGADRYEGDRVIYPRYGRSDYMTPQELDFVRNSYAALVTLVDRGVGELLRKIYSLGLDDSTLVVFLTDHGHLFGDKGLQGKPTGMLGSLYEPTIRSPLLIRHPDGLGAATRPTALVQHSDLLPTILDFLQIPSPSTVQGNSLLPFMDEPDKRGREMAFSGRYSQALEPGGSKPDALEFDGWAGMPDSAEPLTVTTHEWSVIYPPGGRPPEAYHLPEDPRQDTDVAAARPRAVGELREALLEFLTDAGAQGRRLDLYRADGGVTVAIGAAERVRTRSTLEPDDVVFTIIDADGRRYAFTAEQEAIESLSDDMPAQEICSLSFGELLRTDSHTLVHLDQQYYWATDLATDATGPQR